MDLKFIIHHYWPYWLLGVSMIVATLRSEYKDLMKFNLGAFLKFVRIMLFVTIFRVIMMHLNPPTLQSAAPILRLPLWLTGTVGWEDASFCLPLALMARFLGDNIPSRLVVIILSIFMQFAFFTGHIYEGIFSAIMISFYIPYVTMLGKKHGFGTTMACHILYDFLTLLTVRLFLGV